LLSFEAIAREWLEKDQARNRSHNVVMRRMAFHALPAWGKRSVSEIGLQDAHRLIDGIVAKGKVTTARRLHSHLSRFFRWAASRGYIERAQNPMLDVESPGSEVRRDRVLTDSELVAVWGAAEQMGWPYGHAIKLLILTAARREEIWQLRWDEIHRDEIRLPGPRTKTGHKTGQMHIIPISSVAMKLLESVPRIAGATMCSAPASQQRAIGPMQNGAWTQLRRLLHGVFTT
jgi:integrase